MQEALRFWAHILQPPNRPDPTTRITTFFKILASNRGTKGMIDTISYPDYRPVRICGTSPAALDLSSETVLDSSLGDKLGPPDLNNAQTPLDNELVDNPHLPLALHQANKIFGKFSVFFIQPRMLGEMGLILRPISPWIFSVRTFHTWYLLSSCIIPFIFMHCIFYRRPFGSPAFYGHHCTQQSLWPTLWSLVVHKYNYLILSLVHQAITKSNNT